jgi:ribonuclease Z
MHITLLGTGTPAPLPHRLGPATLVTIGHEHLLFDAGRGVTTQLVRAGVALQHLGPLFLTHHNYDHITNLGDLLLSAWHADHPPPLRVIGPEGTDAIVEALLRHVYAREIAFTTRLALATGAAMRPIDELLAIKIVAPRAVVYGTRWRVRAAAVDHGVGLGFSYADWPCLGYRVEAEGKAIAISGDTIACDGLADFAAGADVLVQCCHLPAAVATTPSQRVLAETVIASAAMAGQIAAAAGVQTLVLTHLGPSADAMPDQVAAEVRQTYTGNLVIGSDLLVIPV